MADDTTPPEEQQPEEEPAAEAEQPAAEEPAAEAEEPAAEEPAAEEPAAAEAEQPSAEEPAAEAEHPAAEEPPAAEAPAAEGEQPAPAAEEPAAAEAPAAEGEQPAAAEIPAAEGEQPAAAEIPAAEAEQPAAEEPPAQAEQPAAEAPAAEEPEEEPAPRVKPAIPGADLEVDIVVEGQDPFSRGEYEEEEEEEGEEPAATAEDAEAPVDQPIAAVTIDLAAGARYRATGKRKTAVARVTLLPGDGTYTVNGRPLDTFFPRDTLQRTIRQPLEAVGYEDRMDVVARLHGGGVSAQAGALRHGVSRALLEADPNLRAELKRRGFLTRDPRVKERKKAGLKKARKRPQFSKR